METVNQEQATEKVFTQAEVDAIVSDRLKRDRARYADYDAAKEKAEKYDALEESSRQAIERGNALQAELDSLKSANAVRDMKIRIAEETGVPVKLLTCTTEEECRSQAKAILEYAKPKYPNIRDGGEIEYTGKPTTRQQFADWAKEAFG